MNLFKLNELQKKLEQGKEITLAFHGGSVTSGICMHRDHCFPALVVNELTKRYPNATINILDYSDPGRPSTHGIYTAATKIVYDTFDLIFLEFSVNDVRDDFHQSCFEGMVKMLLDLPFQPMVVPLLTINENGYSCSSFMNALAKHYDLPVVSIGNELTKQIKNGQMKWSDYSDDYIHPSPNGYIFITSMIIDFLCQPIHEDYPPYQLPQKPFFSDSYAKIKFIHLSWDSNKNPEMKFSFTGNTLLLVYINTNEDDYGTAVVKIDNKKEAVIQSFRMDTWPHEFCEKISLTSSENHTFSIAMLCGETSKRFHLIDVGIFSV